MGKIPNFWAYVAGTLAIAFVSLGFYTIIVVGERNVLSETINTKNKDIEGKDKDIAFMAEWMRRDAIDEQKKDAEYNRTMASKPKYITQIKYVPTGDDGADLKAIAEEARKNAEGGKI